MTLNELLELTKKEIEISGGDTEVGFLCDHIQENEPLPLHGFGWYGSDGKRMVFLGCRECHDEAIRDKHRFDGEDYCEMYENMFGRHSYDDPVSDIDED